nr:VOC family protein [Kineococcus siccus]
MDPRPEYEGTGRVASIVVAAGDAAALRGFWALATGWTPVEGSGVPALRRGAAGPFLEFVDGAGAHEGKNRWHLDVRPTRDGAGRDGAGRDGAGRDAVLTTLLAAGAAPVDIGQRGVTWDVLADPEGNEFCVLAGPL